MQGVVQSYIRAKKSLFQSFNCEDDYYVKPMLDFNWSICERDGINFLAYWTDNKSKTEAMILKKDNIFRQREFTMVVAIDCVKIAFVMNNNLEQK